MECLQNYDFHLTFEKNEMIYNAGNILNTIQRQTSWWTRLKELITFYKNYQLFRITLFGRSKNNAVSYKDTKIILKSSNYCIYIYIYNNLQQIMTKYTW